ncbi:LuxR family transcriptional regulator, maltose regulon positive regulatory protein [Desulfocicer vacuolatum DSM 3385]|uniref:LuxR family transcriptional regulator, maltose regulon positive regulatory protein n=1 Tax=Desulfocicer vacuolatum DSM 3385 TaxID=1121400 RepID=A0A1W1YRE3_9BACT|nr:LuxR C-terminal-related transcriptional regulator [Desulfocicer vacuolatum]SMC38729.1 LuxR family transcriptional regulator, maltose regulon positive regulatory protein [Desulfocicer vacuolatum DSM 3385]
MQLLKTKFHIPGLSNGAMVHRERISRIMDESASICILSAPAGFGKTTLLSQWARRCKAQVAWISLEKSEDIPVVFWRYFITAVSSVLKKYDNCSLEQIKSSNGAAIENILITLINEIIEDKTEFTLVLDDYHVISHGSIHGGMEFLMDHLPCNMRIIIAGREEPRISLSKYRVWGKLIEIREIEFRFNTDETEALLNGVHGFNLNKNAILSIRNKTEGWIAGLALAVVSMKEQTDRAAFIDAFTGSHRYIIDYLAEEVLSGLGQEIKDFMIRIAILERFCPALCRDVTQNPQTHSILMDMEQRNLFMVPLDDRREWFRYHHLFREFLLKRQVDLPPREVKDLHFKAFVWLKDKGYATEAFEHGLLGENYRAAATLLAENAPELFREYGGYMLKQSIDRLPPRIVHENAVLCCYSVWLNVLAGDFKGVALLYKERFKGDKGVAGFTSLIKSYRYFYQTGEFKKSIKEVKCSLQLLPEKDSLVREMGQLVLVLALRYSGDMASAHAYLKKMPMDADTSVLRAISYADVLLTMGDLSMALSFIEKIIENGILRYGNDLVPEYGFLYILKGGILRERDDIKGALKACRRGLFLARNNEYAEIIFLGNLEYARILAADKSYEASEKAMVVSIEAARASSTWGAFMSMAHWVRIQISRGNMAGAKSLLKEMGDFSQTDIPYHRQCEYLSFCRYCLYNKKTSQVHEITTAMIKEDLVVKRNGRLLECYLLKAIAYFVDRNMEKALDTLKKAFDISEKEKQVRIYMDEGAPVQLLFKEALKRELLPDYLIPFVDEAFPRQSQTRWVIINEFKENFNDREIEILKLMKKGSSNKIIANTLFLSVNTVRWYASRIFAKLNVKRRGEAVAVAETYDLI